MFSTCNFINGCRLFIETNLSFVLLTLFTVSGVILTPYLFLRQKYKLLEQALDEVSSAVIVQTPRGKVVFANMQGQGLLPHLATRVNGHLKTVAAEEKIVKFSLPRPDQPSPAEAQLRPLRGVRPHVLTLIDRPLEKQGDAAALPAPHALLDDFKHEAMTPLTAIESHAHYLYATDTREDVQRSYTTINQSIQSLNHLFRNFVAYMKFGRPHLEHRQLHSLRRVAEDAYAQLINQALERNIAVEFKMPAERLELIKLDYNEWRQVFSNLLENGLKYGREQGTITVEFEQSPTHQTVRISDNGPGIEPEELPHLFKPFFRSVTQKETAGSGLGLAITKRAVENHNGRISCHSTKDEGTTFEIILPWESNVSET